MECTVACLQSVSISMSMTVRVYDCLSPCLCLCVCLELFSLYLSVSLCLKLSVSLPLPLFPRSRGLACTGASWTYLSRLIELLSARLSSSSNPTHNCFFFYREW